MHAHRQATLEAPRAAPILTRAEDPEHHDISSRHIVTGIGHNLVGDAIASDWALAYPRMLTVGPSARMAAEVLDGSTERREASGRPIARSRLRQPIARISQIARSAARDDQKPQAGQGRVKLFYAWYGAVVRHRKRLALNEAGKPHIDIPIGNNTTGSHVRTRFIQHCPFVRQAHGPGRLRLSWTSRLIRRKHVCGCHVVSTCQYSADDAHIEPENPLGRPLGRTTGIEPATTGTTNRRSTN